MKDSRMELLTGANYFRGVIYRILLFYYGDVIWWPFIYFNFYLWGSIYIQRPSNSIPHVSIAKVSLSAFFVSIHIIWEFSRYGLQEKAELPILSFCFMLIENGKAWRLSLDTRAALPLIARGANSHFPVFLHYERGKTCKCSFTAALVGGKIDFPVCLRS